MKHRVALTALALVTSLAVPPAGASASPVNWSEAYPTTGDVTIPQGQTVILDTNLDLNGLVINGTLKCGNAAIRMEARYILVNGTFRCGTNANRFTKNLTITLRGTGNANFLGYGDKFLVVEGGGKLSLHGKARTPWVRLTETASAGATTLHLEDHDWRVGDRLVIASTDFRAEQAEEVRIVAKNGNTVTIDEPLEYMHYCGTETYRNREITECAEVGLLKRNITIRGNANSDNTLLGGHAMFRSGAEVKIEGVTFQRMGQVGRLGRYPVHFHLFGDGSTSYFRHNTVWRAYNRWVTMHGVQNLRVNHNVAYDTLGHGYYMEDGNEVGNRMVGNLGVLAREGQAGNLTTPSDDDAAVFWFANPDNYIVGNVAAGGDHSGFWYALPEHPLGPSYDPTIWPRQTPLDKFHNNTAHSVGFAGLMIDLGERPDRTLETTWYNPREIPGDNDSPHVVPKFTAFTSYKSRNYGMWVRTFSGAIFDNVAYADNWRSFYLANIQSGPSRDNVGLVRNSLLVGETSNVGQPESWETTGLDGRSLPKFWEPNAALGGVPFYDGPMHVKSTVFANFKPNAQRDAGALTNLFPNAFWVSPENAVWKLKFVNSKKVLLPDVAEFIDGDATTVFTDVLGSVTGVPGSSVTVRDSLVANSSCSIRSQWNARQCGPDVGHMSMVMSRLDGDWARVEMLREGGKRMGFDGSGDQDSTVFFTLITEMTHTLSWEGSVPRDFNMYVAGWSPAAEGEGARFAFPAPGGSWDFQVNGQTTPANSLNALNAGPSNWYYDSNTNLVHVRLVGDNWVTMRG